MNADEAEVARTLRRAARRLLLRLLPPLVAAYVLLLLDRSSLAFAGPDAARALGMTPTQLGLAGPILFLGVLLFEVPGTLLGTRGGSPGRVRNWLLLLLGAEAAAAAMTALAPSPGWFLAGRVLSSLAGAALLPASLFLVADSVPPALRTRAMAGFVLASLLLPLVAPPVGAAFAGLSAATGSEGWRGLFAGLAGCFALCGVLLFALVPAAPRAARWLSDAERGALAWSRSLEPRPRRDGGGVAALAAPGLLLLAAANAGLSVSAFAAGTWYGVLVGGDARAPVPWIGLVFMAVAVLTVLFWARHADRKGRVQYGFTLTCGVGAVGFAAAVVPGFVMTALAGLLAHGAMLAAGRALLWSATARLAGAGSGGAAAFALVDAVGLLGAFVAPRVLAGLAGGAGSLQAGLLLMVGVLAATTVAAWALRMTAARD